MGGPVDRRTDALRRTLVTRSAREGQTRVEGAGVGPRSSHTKDYRFRASITLWAISKPTRRLASTVWAPKCGVATTRG